MLEYEWGHYCSEVYDFKEDSEELQRATFRNLGFIYSFLALVSFFSVSSLGSNSYFPTTKTKLLDTTLHTFYTRLRTSSLQTLRTWKFHMNIHKTRVDNSVEISTDYLWNMTLVSTVILWISHTNILDITIHSSDKSTEADCILHNMPTIYT